MKVAVKGTNTTESPFLSEKKTQIDEFLVLTPEQSKFIKPLDIEALSMIPEGDPNLTSYSNELLRTNRLEQQNYTFWVPTPENLSRIEDHIPIQT